jgi:hypothetical protein
MLVQDAILPPFAAWETFYVIVGSGGAALTGLQFVVMALVAESRRATSPDTIGAFGTPTIVHFCAVLFVASVLAAPWRTLMKPAVVLGLIGAAGIVYIGIITARARRQADYKPVLEDWIWHNALPFIAYAVLLAGAIGLERYAHESLFAVAATSLLLLFIGIHNAWDTVTYVAVVALPKNQAPPVNHP